MTLGALRAASGLLLGALLAACGGLQPEDPGLVLRQGGAATATLKTVDAAMKVTTGTISFQGFSLVSATAAVRLPDESVETIDGVDCHKVSALFTAAQITGLLPQLSSQADVTATIWVGGSDHFIRRAVLGGNFGDNGALSTVEVDLSNFNGSVDIASPGRTN